MDFVSRLPLSLKKKYAIWVVIDRLTKSAHFILVRMDYSLDKLAELYISEIVRLHRVPVSIISDRDLRFTSQFWKKLPKALGIKLNCSTAFHPQIDGQSKRVIQILEDMLRCCVLEFKGNWERFFPLVEFAYNNNFQSSIKMIVDKVFLKVSPWKKILIFGLKGKLSPRFIGPYEIIKRIAQEVKQLKNKSIALVKVLWQWHGVEEATWEPEGAMRKLYPNLFTGKTFEDENP
ncbi:Gag protease polyprotein [Gossypium australe]|uniref:Gag protease polyprotein n=1 Tax=Gossypium australe TaxID=47621 RepID=A0A5B6W6Z8_9ROSI|nr:Gag protease polyprotein [Gossypium australe]